MIKTKKEKIQLILLLTLIVIAFIFFFSNRKSTLSKSEEKISLPDTASIERIMISSDSNECVLEKKGKSWLVNYSYPARIDAINLLLENMSSIKLAAIVPQQQEESARKILLSNHTFLEFFYKDGTTISYRISTHQKKSSLIQIDNNRPLLALIPGYKDALFKLFPPIEKYWRDNLVFNLIPYEIKNITSEFSSKEKRSFMVENLQNGYFRVIDNNSHKVVENIDPKKLENYLLTYEQLRFHRSINIDIDSIRNTMPLVTIIVNDIYEGSSEVSFYARQNKEGLPDPFYCLILINNKEVAEIKYSHLEFLLKDISGLMK